MVAVVVVLAVGTLLHLFQPLQGKAAHLHELLQVAAALRVLMDRTQLPVAMVALAQRATLQKAAQVAVVVGLHTKQRLLAALAVAVVIMAAVGAEAVLE
jgi:uncharacterized protein YhhL (DUF1145 family)